MALAVGMAGRANVQVPVTSAVHRLYQAAAGREAQQDSSAFFRWLEELNGGAVRAGAKGWETSSISGSALNCYHPATGTPRNRRIQEDHRSLDFLVFLRRWVFLRMLRWVLGGIRNQQVEGSSPPAGSSDFQGLALADWLYPPCFPPASPVISRSTPPSDVHPGAGPRRGQALER
jgi:hypothetical protein